jgi:hypothetical protein
VDPFESLSLCAEVAIAITGFSGVVLVFGDRRPSSSTRVDPVLFRIIFTGTLTPLGLVVIAFLLDAAEFGRPEIWRISSTVHAVSVSLLYAFGGGTSEQRRSFSRARGGRIVTLASLLVIALSVLNAVSLHQFWPFLFAVWYGMALALFAFVQLVFSSRPNR